MNKILLGLVVFLGLLSIYFMVSTDEVFICSDGTEVSNPSECPISQEPMIPQTRAQTNAQTYGQVYAQALGKQFTLVNSYREEENYMAVGLFSTRGEDSTPLEVTFLVDGRTGSVSCYDGCEVLEREDVEEELEEELEQSEQ